MSEVNDEVSREIRQYEKEAGTKLEAVDYGIDQALKELLQLSDPQKQTRDDYYTKQLLNEYNDKVLSTRCTQLKKSAAPGLSPSLSFLRVQLKSGEKAV